MITAVDFRRLSNGAEYAEIERRVDNAIHLHAQMRRFDSPIRVSVDGCVSEMVREIMLDYGDAGWQVTMVNHYSEGAFLELRSR